MKIELIRATEDDANELWEIQVKSFQKLLDTYRDFETNPACEPVERIISRLKQTETYYYYISSDGVKVGAIRVIDHHTKENKRISPLFILPEHQNKGYAQMAMQECERIHGSENWELDTILQEEGNCHLYEKMGYRRTRKTEVINEKMTLVFYVK